MAEWSWVIIRVELLSGVGRTREEDGVRSTSSTWATVAREAFGDFVFEHLLNTAVQEQVIFDNTTVTDWELARYFERG